MSITIMAENTPNFKEQMPCSCEGEFRACCPDCEGNGYFTYTVYRYELNSSNQNFYALMEVLGFKDIESCGCFTELELVALRAKLLIARNSIATRAKGIRETDVIGNMTQMGLSDESIAYRLEKLEEIVVWAQSNNKRITWG